MLETKITQKLITYKQYQLGYDDDSDEGFTLNVCNTVTLDKYLAKNVKIKNINYKGFQAALVGKNKDFTLDIKQVESEKEGEKTRFLEITIVFKSAFLMSITEKIIVPYLCKSSQLEFYLLKIQKLGQKIKQTIDKNPKMVKTYKLIDEKEFKSNIDPNYGDYGDGGGNESDYDMKPFESIKLPEEGRYLIEITMYLNSTNSYYYFYHNANYQTVFPAGAMMVPVNNKYIPIKLTYIVNTQIDGLKQHTFYAYDIADYPFKVSNLVITATKLPE